MADEGFRLNQTISYIIGFVAAFGLMIVYAVLLVKRRLSAEKEK